MIFIQKICKKCGQMRKFVEGTPRDIESICGNCWDYNSDEFENTSRNI